MSERLDEVEKTLMKEMNERFGGLSGLYGRILEMNSLQSQINRTFVDNGDGTISFRRAKPQ